MKDGPLGTPEYSGGWEIPEIRKILGIWDTRKDRETRKIQEFTENGEIGEKRYTSKNLGTFWNPRGFRGIMCLEDPEDWEIPELGNCENREFGSFGEFGCYRASGNWGKSLYVAEVRDAVGANARTADELGN